MKNEKLLDAIGQIDDELIFDAGSDMNPAPNRLWFKRGLITAACLAAAAVATVFIIPFLHKIQQKTDIDTTLPLLTISEMQSDAMGFEGYMAYDISELINANPWNENMNLSTLPVYENPLSYDDNFIVSGADFNAMEAFLTDIAKRLGMDMETLEITDNTPSEEYKAAILEKTGGDIPDGYFNPTKVIAKQNGIKIEVEPNMTAVVSFEPAVSLPEQYDFSHYASYEDTVAAAGYLSVQYADFISMKNPKMNIHGGDYNIYSQQDYGIEFFNAGGSDTEQIINYNFNRVAFYCDDNGELFLARVYQPDLSNKTGDYPVISSDEAKELLLAGNYITTVPYVMPGENYIAKTELVYRTGRYEKYYMPYYRFYVELPEEEREGGMKTYGAYYVPAISGSYISNMPVWDGSFN